MEVPTQLATSLVSAPEKTRSYTHSLLIRLADLNYPPNVRPPQPPSTTDPSMEMMHGQQILGQHAQPFPEYPTFNEAGQYPSPQVSQYGGGGGQYSGQYPHQQASYTSSYMQRPDQAAASTVQPSRPHLGDHAVDSDGEGSTTRSQISASY